MRTLILLLLPLFSYAQLPASGSLSLKSAAGAGRSISQQVDGNETGNKSLTTLSNTVGFSAPHSMLEFRGYPSDVSNNLFVGANGAFSGTMQLYYSTDGTNYSTVGAAFTTTDCDYRGTLSVASTVPTVYLRVYSSATSGYISFKFNTVVTAGETCIDSDATGTTASFSNTSGSRYMYLHDVAIPAAPGPVSNVNAYVPTTSMVIEWAAPTTGGAVTNYVVEKSTNFGAWTFLGNAGTSLSIGDGAIAVGNEYQYRVKATNAGGESAYVNSNPVQY